MNLPDNFIVLGADNSFNCTGWSIIKITNYNTTPKLELVDYGFINTHKLSNEASYIVIENTFNNIIKQYKPNYIAAESAFIGKNKKTGMVLAHIHGIMLLVAAKNSIPVRYYAVMTLKSQVLGGITIKKNDGTKKTGDEMKEEVAAKIFEILGRQNFIKPFTPDVTDSISAIITFLKMQGEEVKKAKKTKTVKSTKKTTK